MRRTQSRSRHVVYRVFPGNSRKKPSRHFPLRRRRRLTSWHRRSGCGCVCGVGCGIVVTIGGCEGSSVLRGTVKGRANEISRGRAKLIGKRLKIIDGDVTGEGMLTVLAPPKPGVASGGSATGPGRVAGVGAGTGLGAGICWGLNTGVAGVASGRTSGFGKISGTWTGRVVGSCGAVGNFSGEISGRGGGSAGGKTISRGEVDAARRRSSARFVASFSARCSLWRR